jgi:hypothetical protein
VKIFAKFTNNMQIAGPQFCGGWRDPMRKSVFVVAALVAAVSTAAVAKDVKQEKRATGPVQMTDAEMDKVTAGFSTDNNGLNGGGIGFGNGHGNGKGLGATNGNGRFSQ